MSGSGYLGAQEVESCAVSLSAQRRRAAIDGRLTVGAADKIAHDVWAVAIGSFAEAQRRVALLGRDIVPGRNGLPEEHRPERICG
jgi:hypothetical protein